MGKYDDLLTEDSPSPTPAPGKYADLLEEEPKAGKYADLLEAADTEQSPTPETDKAIKESGIQKFIHTPFVQGAVSGLSRLIPPLPTSVGGAVKEAVKGAFEQTPVGAAISSARQTVETGQQMAQLEQIKRQFGGGSPEYQKAAGELAGTVIPQMVMAAGVVKGLKTGGGELDAIKRSDAQVEARQAPLGEQARASSPEQVPGGSDYAVREAQGKEGQLPQQEPVSTGQPVAPETQEGTHGEGLSPAAVIPPEDIKYTGVRNETYQRLEAEGQLGHVPPGAGRSTADSIAIGRQRLQQGANVNDIANRFWKTRRISDTEFAVLRAYSEQLHGTSLAAEKAMKANPTPENAARFDQAFKQFHDFSRNVVQPAKTATSNIFRAMQEEEPLHVDSFTGLREAVNREVGRDIKPEERPIFEKAAENVQSATRERNAAATMIDTALKKAAPKTRKLITNDDVRNHIADIMKGRFPCG